MILNIFHNLYCILHGNVQMLIAISSRGANAVDVLIVSSEIYLDQLIGALIAELFTKQLMTKVHMEVSNLRPTILYMKGQNCSQM